MRLKVRVPGSLIPVEVVTEARPIVRIEEPLTARSSEARQATKIDAGLLRTREYVDPLPRTAKLRIALY
ncbi:hypothetical protein [Roseomonas rosulenta]|uniref:hypothetical protein n=1 Tax=Roseomonas rosulenta TaxID=2748667 RepID=UPI0018DF7432|nr:hypothetical protein [Roseomonas rosulenta]